MRGRDVAGRVEAVGANVTRFQPGDEVFGTCEGSFAEYAAAREDKLALKPANLSFEEAAVIPISGMTALQALRDKGRVKPGDKVLIIGAGGGVGTFAIQLAKAFGAEVTGVCSTTKVGLVESIGADHIIDYTREDFADRAGHTTSSSTTPAIALYPSSGEPWRRMEPSSSSAARMEERGSGLQTGSCPVAILSPFLKSEAACR